MSSIKKVPDVGVKHRGSTDNKLGGGLITKYILISCSKIISKLLNARSFFIIQRFFPQTLIFIILLQINQYSK
jgi:hypothetical protein